MPGAQPNSIAAAVPLDRLLQLRAEEQAVRGIAMLPRALASAAARASAPAWHCREHLNSRAARARGVARGRLQRRAAATRVGHGA